MKSSKYAIAVVCMILSFFVALQTKSVFKIKETGTIQNTRAEKLQVELNEEREKNADIYEQLLKYRDELDEYVKKAEEVGGYTQILSSRLKEVSVMAGITEVTGTGVTVTLKDSKAANIEGFDENNFVIHDEDLLRVINELRDAGAEALSLNGERILATSEIRCSGSTVSINNNRYSAPYVIQAIGNPIEMEGALNMRQGVVEILKQWGIEVTIKKQDSIVISAYSGDINHKYAQSVTKE